MRTNHTFRPINVLGPVARQPGHSSFVPADLDVAAGDKSIELLAVAEQPPADSRALKTGGVAKRFGGPDKGGDEVHTSLIGNFTAPVNGYLTGRRRPHVRSDYRTMLKAVVARVHQRLDALGKSARAASLEAGLSEDAIRNMERAVKNDARSGASTKTLTALAPVLETTVAWLMEGAGDEVVEATTDSVPVVGYVSAGAVAVLYDAGQGPFDMVPAPEGSTSQTVAAEIRGDSLGPIFDTWLVYWDDVRSPVTSDLIGELCVIGLPDGRIVVKKLRQASNGLFHLISNLEGPMLDQEILWAAKVKRMTPR